MLCYLNIQLYSIAAVQLVQRRPCSGSRAANTGQAPKASIAFRTPAPHRVLSEGSAIWNAQFAGNAAGTVKTNLIPDSRKNDSTS